MRNLKKFLALVLALVMAFSLMVTANAAVTKVATKDADKYSDGDKVLKEFQVAVDVTSGMKIFKGEGGNFKPTDKIMRCEVVAMMYRLCTGDVKDSQAKLYAPEAYTFNDVKAIQDKYGDVWYDGYLGYCVSAGIIKGYNGNFNPTSNVTGYEMLIMLLRAVGYGKNGEYTGAMFRVNSASDAQRLGILSVINKTHYANTLGQYSDRQVVAEMLFEAMQLPKVRWELGMYNQYIGVPVTGGVGSQAVLPEENTSLAWDNFGFWHWNTGVVLGNQDTGAPKTMVGEANTQNGSTKYTWNNRTGMNLVTGLEMIGHKIDLYYCASNHPMAFSYGDVFAHYDKADKAVTVTVRNDTVMQVDDPDTANTLGAIAAGNGFTVIADNAADDDVGTLVWWNNSFGLGGTNNGGDGVREDGQNRGTSDDQSPNNMYMLISNSDMAPNSLDVVIPLNIETSQITESNSVRGVPTVAVPVDNSDTVKYISDNNVYAVNALDQIKTGIMAKDALTQTAHESTTTLGDYELGIRINGTPERYVDATETAAILNTGDETAYYLLYKVEPTVTGRVITYNADKGEVNVLVNGEMKTLHRSKYYDTVVGTKTLNPVLPQSQDAALNESYNLADYTFYTDWEGNYLGAVRGYTNDFFYGTYLDYDQKTSSSTFNYYLTGVTLDGKVDTRVVTKEWTWTLKADAANRTTSTIRGTDWLGVPYRDTFAADGYVNGLSLGEGYKGYTFTSGVLDPNLYAGNVNTSDYATNMDKLNVLRALDEDDATGTNGGEMATDIVIGGTALALGVKETYSGSGLFMNDETKIILVSGTGTDTLKAEVYTGINELVKKNDATGATFFLDPDGTDDMGNPTGIWVGTDRGDGIPNSYAAMTYYKKSPYTFAQSGDTAMKVDVIILPKNAVKFSYGSESDLYFIGDPSYSLVASHEGRPVYKYTVYNMEGVASDVWLDEAPADVYNDSFLRLTRKATPLENTNEAVYTVSWLENRGVYASYSATPSSGLIDGENAVVNPVKVPVSTVSYSTTTRNAQTATFIWSEGGGAFLRVAGANVTNLNKANSPSVYGGSGYVWPGINDLTTLNEAGSIDPVTGGQNLGIPGVTSVKVAAVVDGLNVTQIFVCWDQRDTSDT